MRESFVKAPPCHIRKLRVKASAKPVQDPDKADIIGGGDLHIGVDESLNSTINDNNNN